MAKAIKASLMETSLNINLNISTDEIVHACGDTSGTGDQHWVKRICTKTDNALKGVMKAHLEERSNRLVIR